MTVFKRGGKYWYEFTFRGIRIRESSNSSNKDVCGRMERERRRSLELNIGGLAELSQPRKFLDAVNTFLLEQEPHWAPKTRIIHANSLVHLAPHFGKLTLPEIRVELISRYQRARLKEHASNRSVNIEVGLLRLVLRKAKLWSNIQDDVHMLKERRDIGRALSADESMRLLSAAKASVSRSLYPAILVSIHTGLRNKELRLLQWRQIDLIGRAEFPNGFITVGESKTEGGEGRIVPLSLRAQATLQNWRSKFPDAAPSHYVFPRESYGLIGQKGTFGGTVAPYEVFPGEPIGSWKSAWQRAKKAAGVECRWHDLRHSFISLVAEGQASDGTIQALAGWMSPKMIERYSHARNAAKIKAISVLDEPQDPRGTHKKPHSVGIEKGRSAVSN
jgi:integrase